MSDIREIDTDAVTPDPDRSEADVAARGTGRRVVAVIGVLGALVLTGVVIGFAPDPSPSLGRYAGIDDPATRERREAQIAKLPALAITGPAVPTAPPDKVTRAQVAAMPADEFWGVTRATTSETHLTQLVRWGAPRQLHDHVWNAMWGRIETPGAPGHEQAPALLDEAERLATAIESATGDRSYATRVREWRNTHDRVGRKQRWVAERLAAARQAWRADHDADRARAALGAARAAARKLEDATLLESIAALEAELPAPAKR